jgi:hypothetical protein
LFAHESSRQTNGCRASEQNDKNNFQDTIPSVAVYVFNSKFIQMFDDLIEQCLQEKGKKGKQGNREKKKTGSN